MWLEAEKARNFNAVVWVLGEVNGYTASVADAMTGTNWRYTSGFGVGRPSDGSRACRWMIAAPASAASIDCLAICSGVSGRYSDIDGVWVDPVIAQEMMTLRFEFFIVFLTVNGARD